MWDKELQQLAKNNEALQKEYINLLRGLYDITSFHSADDVITLLIHMGYLAYANKAEEVFLPNEEVRNAFLRAIKNDGWNEVIQAVNASEV